MTDNRTTELRKALDFMRIWISDDAHLGESEFSYELEKAEGLRKLEAIEQAIAATLGVGKLTAEQVRKAIFIGGVWDEDNAMYYVSRTDMQAIADELNAELGSGTCDDFSLPEPDGWYKCPDCRCSVGYTELYGGGWSIMMDDYQIPFNNCPNCGKAVKR